MENAFRRWKESADSYVRVDTLLIRSQFKTEKEMLSGRRTTSANALGGE